MADESDYKFRIEVQNLAGAIRAIGKFDPELRKQILKDMKGVAQPMVADARGRIPEVALSNWGNWRGGYDARAARRRTNVAVRTGAVKGESRDTIPLLTLRTTDAAGAIFDMAGRRSAGQTPAGSVMIQTLNTFAQASRTLWPAAEAHIGSVEAGLEGIINTVSAEIERNY